MLKGGGVQFEILKNPGIYFNSGFRKNAEFEILKKKCASPLDIIFSKAKPNSDYLS